MMHHRINQAVRSANKLSTKDDIDKFLAEAEPYTGLRTDAAVLSVDIECETGKCYYCDKYHKH